MKIIISRKIQWSVPCFSQKKYSVKRIDVFGSVIRTAIPPESDKKVKIDE